MSTEPVSSEPPAETPARHVAAVQKKKNLYLRVTSSMPLLVTVIVHLVLIGVAAAVVVQQNILGKKKTFEAAAADTAPRPEEHRLQIARRGGASGGAASPVSASRILSTADTALATPEMPELPAATGGFGGFGAMGSGIGLGAGTGMSTSLGRGAGLGGRGFMSLSFLGTTSQNASRIVFALDVEAGLMDVRRGGYSAFKIIRDEMTRLVLSLPPQAEFNVVVFEYTGSRETEGLFSPELLPASSENKKRFAAWLGAVNGSPGGPYGIGTAANLAHPDFAVPDSVKLDADYRPPYWMRGLHAAFAQKPDTIFLISGSSDLGRVDRGEAGLWERKHKEWEDKVAKQREEIVKMGLDPDAVAAARRAAYDKARRELDAINQKLIAAKKDPFVIKGVDRIFEKDFQDALRKQGFSITLDTAGWTDKKGAPIPEIVWRGAGGWRRATPQEAAAYVGRLQRAYRSEPAHVNLFYLAGPAADTEGPTAALAPLARRNGGNFSVLTAKRLEELASDDGRK